MEDKEYTTFVPVTVDEPAQGEEIQEGEIITIGDVLDTLTEDQMRKVKILARLISQGKSADKMEHHLHKYGLNEMQIGACYGFLKVAEMRRLEGK